MGEVRAGQKLWFVPSERRRTPYEIEVQSVGRKWVNCNDRLRFDMDTLEADGHGYSSPGKAYLTKADYELARRRSEAWSHLVQTIARLGAWRAPEHLTTAKIEEITALVTNPSRALLSITAKGKE